MHLARLGAPVTKPAAPKPGIHIGCSGWFYWEWKGLIYPEGLSTKEWFPHYTQKFATVELNAPFYSWPTVASVQGWKRNVARPDFVYTVKVCELITHIKQFEDCRELILDFGYIADLLGPMMGCFLYQLPPSFDYTPARLKNILTQLDHNRRNVVEFRHVSWWNDKVYKAFEKTGTIFCSCSGPKLPQELIKTAADVYIRFHGIEKWYKHDYSPQELGWWTEQIKTSGAKSVWAYFNNTFHGDAVKNAQEFGRQLGLKL